MESYDEFVEESQSGPKRSGGGAFWNLLSVVFLLGALCLGSVAVMIFLNPTSPLNIFPPATLPPTIFVPSPTATIWAPTETWTPTATFLPTDTATPEPPSPTPTELPPDDTPIAESGTPAVETPTVAAGVTPSVAAESSMPFVVQDGNPLATTSAVQHPELGCNWMGVGGQVFDKNGAPAVGFIVMLGGTLNGKTVSMFTLSGTYTNYGPAGYEFKLADAPIASSQEVWIQLFDQARLPLSKPVYLNTFNDCNRNLTMVNFKQIK